MRQFFGAGCITIILFAGVRGAAAADEQEQLQAKLQAVQKQRAELLQQQQALSKQEQDLQSQLRQAREKESGAIKAVVTGVLHPVENGRCPFISVRSIPLGYEPVEEYRVYLLFSEDKVTGRKMAPLFGKRIVAHGDLKQMPKDVQASVPPFAMYMDAPEFEAAESK
jgi:multidrug efflux pump subunit AcrA (membrane-fusion protein)